MSCELWTGYVTAQGYGQEGSNTLVHRAVWEKANGPIPKGMHVHHVCENRLCVTLEHLRLVTPGEHLRIHRSSEACPVCGSTRPRIQNMRNGKPNGTKCRDCHNRKTLARYYRRKEKR